MSVSVFSLAVTITGTFIGAGFMSGQELWQFFGSFGESGLLGFILAIIVMSILSAITLYFVFVTKSNTFEKIVCNNQNIPLKLFITAFQFVFYIGIYVIMTAGVESLVSEYFTINRLFVGIFFCLIVTVITLIGVKGLVSAFSVIIPLLVITTVIIAMLALGSNEVSITETVKHKSLVSNWFVSTIVYVSYNFFAGIGVFASVGSLIKSKRKLISASLLACLFLTILGISILFPVYATGTQNKEMPMLATAMSLNPAIGTVYAILLSLAMLGAAISSLFPIAEWFKNKFPNNKTINIISIFIVSFITIFLSLFGFSDLIGTVYPFFGYVGIFIIIVILRNFYNTVIRRQKW